MKRASIKVTKVARHRNGISGEPFHVVLFKCPDAGNMVATVFEKSGHVAVLNVDKTAAGDVDTFGNNCWRGGHYEKDLRFAIKEHERAEKMEWDARLRAGASA